VSACDFFPHSFPLAVLPVAALGSVLAGQGTAQTFTHLHTFTTSVPTLQGSIPTAKNKANEFDFVWQYLLFELMRHDAIALVMTGLLTSSFSGQGGEATAEPGYTLAFASFAPLNTDIFVADADGSNPRPFLPHPELDYNASFSADGDWIIFTSERNESADIYRAHPDGSRLERLTDDPAFDDQGALSPDGKFLAFVSSRSGQADIWILELGTRKLRNITNHPGGDFRPAWSPDGQWIAFSSDRDSKKPKGAGGFETLHSTEIYLIRPDGSGLRRVTHLEAFAGSPRWSADGKRLLFYKAEITDVRNITGARRLRGTTQIATIDPETNEVRLLTSAAGEKWSPQWLAADRIAYVSGGPEGGIEFIRGSVGARGEFGSPSWSPDGRRMVFHREVDHNWPPVSERHSRDPQFRLIRTGVFPSYSPSGVRLICMDGTAAILSHAILAMNADGSQRSVLFQDAEKSPLCPVWSPQGDRIAFGLGRFFQTVQGRAPADIALMKNDGTGFRILTHGTGNHGFPSWSPDGQRLVYRSSGGDNDGLFIIDIASGEVNSLITGATHDNFPAWSPTGDRIAFTSYRDGDYEIYTIKPDGTDLTRLTHSPGNDAHCAWSPDGKWIAFASQRGGFKDEAVLHPYNPQPYGDIYVMRADGSDVRQLTDNQFEEATPSWLPVREKGN
jgi:Tol biopolymer transport system component